MGRPGSPPSTHPASSAPPQGTRTGPARPALAACHVRPRHGGGRIAECPGRLHERSDPLDESVAPATVGRPARIGGGNSPTDRLFRVAGRRRLAESGRYDVSPAVPGTRAGDRHSWCGATTPDTTGPLCPEQYA